MGQRLLSEARSVAADAQAGRSRCLHGIRGDVRGGLDGGEQHGRLDLRPEVLVQRARRADLAEIVRRW